MNIETSEDLSDLFGADTDTPDNTQATTDDQSGKIINQDTNQEPTDTVSPTETTPAVVAPAEVKAPDNTLPLTKIIPPVVKPVAEPAATAVPVATVKPATTPVVASTPVAPMEQVAPISQEDLNQQLNVFSFTEKEFGEIFDTEDRAVAVKALDKCFQSAARQALTMANVLIQSEISKFQQTVQPYMEMANSLKNNSMEQEFYGRHPNMVGKQPLVEAVMQAAVNNKMTFNSVDELHNFLVANVEAYSSQLGAFGQSQNQTQPQAPKSARPPMATLSRGGLGGGVVSNRSAPGGDQDVSDILK